MNSFIHPHTPTSTLTILRGSIHLRIADIVRFEADRNYTRIILTNGQVFLTSKNLSFYAALLPEGFVRVHKSHLLNSEYIVQKEKKIIRMSDGGEIEVSRRKRRVVNQMNFLF
jgi:two-component system, LytTR family, response regulator